MGLARLRSVPAPRFFIFVAPAVELLSLLLTVVVVIDLDIVLIAMLGDADVDSRGYKPSEEKNGKDGEKLLFEVGVGSCWV